MRTYLSLQSLTAAVRFIQLGLQLGAILLMLKLQCRESLLQLLLGSLQGFEAIAQLSILGTRTTRNKTTLSSIGGGSHKERCVVYFVAKHVGTESSK